MNAQNTIFINRTFECSIEELFELLTNPAQIKIWFGPKNLIVTGVVSDLRKGGSYAISLKKEDESELTILGEYKQVSPPDLIEFTFRYDGTKGPPVSIVRISLTTVGTWTQLNLKQQFQIIPKDIDTRLQAWENMLEKLSKLVGK